MFDNDYTKNYTTIYEKSQYEILGCVEKDMVTLRLSAMVAVKEPDGKISEPVPVRRSRLITRGTSDLMWLLDCTDNFNEDDLDAVKNKILTLLATPGDINKFADKATKEEVYEKLKEFSRIRINELISIYERIDVTTFVIPECFAKDTMVYIKTTVLSSFISENRDMGWSRMEVLKMLKRYGLLQPGNDRTYDKKIKENGKTANYYVVKMPLDEEGNVIVDDADESIDIHEL